MKSWKELLSGEDPACSIDQKPRILRLRVFAGPNGAGKSTICNAVGAMEVDGRPIDMGYHVNTDDISKQLKHGEVDLESFQLQDFGIGMIYQIARYSKLVGTGFSEKAFSKSHCRL